MRNAGLGELQAGTKTTQEKHQQPQICRCYHSLMAKIKEQLKSLLMRVKEESERASSRLNIEKTKIMAFDPITPWQIEGEKVEVVTDFLFLALKSLQMVTAAMKSEDVCFLAGKL